MKSIRVEWNGPAIDRLKGEARRSASLNAAITTGHRVQREIAQSGRVITGNMMRSVRVSPEENRGERTVYRVGSDLDYFHYQNEGFGPVYPKRAKVLAWRTRGGRLVFARRTKGVKGGRFLQKALRQLRFRDFVP